jgi:hypothetical protein
LSVRGIVLTGIVVVVGIVLAVLFLGGFSGGGRGVTSYTSKSSTSSTPSTTGTIGVSQATSTTTSPIGSTSYSTSTITGTLTTLPKPSSRFIILRVPRDKYVIIYDELVSYNDRDYSLIRAYWDKYVSLMHDRILELYRDAHIVNISITCFDSNHTVKIGFLVTNKVWSNDNEVTADFLWFLNAWSLDFIDNKFSEHNDGLSWSGVLGGVETTIIVKVPPQPGPYKAWSTPYGHCHGHVWWPKK